MSALICKFCGNDFVFVSRTRTLEVFYCDQCGEDWRSERDLPLESWIDKKHQMNQKKIERLRKIK
jgi:hypothetical protein